MQLKLDIKGLMELSTNIGEITERIGRITSDPPFLRDAGQLLVSRGKQNLEDGGHGGTSYALLAPSTRREKSRKGYSLKPLQRTGQMRRSPSYQVAGGLTLSALKTAQYHQEGAPRANIPARPIFTLEHEDIEDIRDCLIRRFKQHVPEAK